MSSFPLCIYHLGPFKKGLLPLGHKPQYIKSIRLVIIAPYFGFIKKRFNASRLADYYRIMGSNNKGVTPFAGCGAF